MEKIKNLTVHQQTIDNTLLVLNSIEDLVNINLDDVYSTKYGTAVMQFSLNNFFIEIEIGKSELGYFIEKDNKDIVLRQNKLDLNLLNLLMNDLKSIMN